MKIRLPRAVLLCSLLVAGLAAQASPRDDLAEGQAAVINAVVAGSQAHAPALLDAARRSLQAARDALARGELEGARRFARQAFDEAAAAEFRALTVREARLDREPKTAATWPAR